MWQSVLLFCKSAVMDNQMNFIDWWDVLLQSTLVISKSKGPSETHGDIRTSTYQMCSIEENTN